MSAKNASSPSKGTTTSASSSSSASVTFSEDVKKDSEGDKSSSAAETDSCSTNGKASTTNSESTSSSNNDEGERDSDGLRRRDVGGAASLGDESKNCNKDESPKKSPKKKKESAGGGFGLLNGLKRHFLGEDSDEEDAKSDQTITTPKKKVPKKAMSFKGSPCHSWISNSSTNPYEGEYDDIEDDDDYFDGGDVDDYEYDPYTHEYVPRIREPPEGEDSDDGLLVSREERDRSLSVIAQALLDSAKANKEHNEKRKSQSSESTGDTMNGGSAGGTGEETNSNSSYSTPVSFLERFFDLCSGSNKLRKIEDMPRYLQFNKHIHSGYRELQDFWGCVFSLGYMHNETINILTHVAPIVYIVMYWHTMFPWDEIIGNTYLNILGCAHIAASISPWIGSVIYHLFMSYDKGDRFYQILLQIDMFGIWITECFGALTNLSAASWCLPKDFQTGIMTAYGLAAVFGLQKALTAWTPVARRMCFAPVFVSRILAFILRLSSWGGGNPDILIHVILQDVLSIAGGIIGVIRIPEKWFPGRLDLVFNSHHIMHILVVIAVCHMNMATNGDIRWIIENYSGCGTSLVNQNSSS